MTEITYSQEAQALGFKHDGYELRLMPTLEATHELGRELHNALQSGFMDRRQLAGTSLIAGVYDGRHTVLAIELKPQDDTFVIARVKKLHNGHLDPKIADDRPVIAFLQQYIAEKGVTYAAPDSDTGTHFFAS